MDPVEGQAGVRVARRHLHPQQPVQLPAGLLEQRGLQAVRGRGGVGAQQVDGGQQLPGRQRTRGHVLAVVAGVVPAAGDVEPAALGPAGVQALGVRAGPGRHGGVAGVRRDSEVAGGSAVTRRPGLVDRAAGALEVEEAEGVGGQTGVEPAVDRERVAGRVAGDDRVAPGRAAARRNPARGRPARGRLGPRRPGPTAPGVGGPAVLVDHDEVDRLGGRRDQGGLLGSGRQVAQLVDPDRRAAARDQDSTAVRMRSATRSGSSR